MPKNAKSLALKYKKDYFERKAGGNNNGNNL
jgi:hypothetical protein